MTHSRGTTADRRRSEAPCRRSRRVPRRTRQRGGTKLTVVGDRWLAVTDARRLSPYYRLHGDVVASTCHVFPLGVLTHSRRAHQTQLPRDFCRTAAVRREPFGAMSGIPLGTPPTAPTPRSDEIFQRGCSTGQIGAWFAFALLRKAIEISSCFPQTPDRKAARLLVTATATAPTPP